ncbi:MAG: hypothetical protein M5U34_07240 [Chloroflexi bacterium]|nr:hypothetical protein [Chloroflexota bacterium]
MEAEISPDGRYVAFMSRANNLLAADQDPSIDVFVFDREAGTLDCITSDQDGDAALREVQRRRGEDRLRVRVG